MRRLYIHTFGCQMNVRDSEQVAGFMEREGYRATSDIQSADLIIVNTCSVRDKAEQKAHSLIGRIKSLKAKKPDIVVGVMGCLAQQWGEALFDRFPHLDFLCGTHAIDQVPVMVRTVQKNTANRRLADTAFRDHPASLAFRSAEHPGGPAAFVTIMQGCNNFCAFCIVPYLRGRERSRPPGDIVQEVTALAGCGVREVTLLGQNVNSYGSTLADSTDFPSLLKQVAAVPGIERIRFTTSHPKDLSVSLMDAFVEIESLCEHIHLPLQAGSDRILRRMKRGYTAEEYLEKILGLRDRIPHLGITTDIIVGFPGESEADFKKTIDLMEKIRFDNAFSFKYSDRAGTRAADYGDKVDAARTSERLSILQRLQSEHTREKHRSLEGTVQPVIVEGPSKGDAGDVMGRTRGNIIVNFRGDTLLTGATVHVRITKGYAHSLRGELLRGEEEHPCS